MAILVRVTAGVILLCEIRELEIKTYAKLQIKNRGNKITITALFELDTYVVKNVQYIGK